MAYTITEEQIRSYIEGLNCILWLQWDISHPKGRDAAVTFLTDLLSEVGQEGAAAIDAAHLERQRQFSERTFGPGPRTEGVLDHIRKELAEVEADPLDLKEWVDVMILAFDGAWRAGWEPQEIIDAVKAKQAKNEERVWPDWRTADTGKAIEHDRSVDPKEERLQTALAMLRSAL